MCVCVCERERGTSDVDVIAAVIPVEEDSVFVVRCAVQLDD